MATLDLWVGAIFGGDYRVVAPLRSGGMGAVYLVEQLSTGTQRALKVMHPELVADPALRKRFEQEARVGSRIESEHVVQVLAAGVDGATGAPWLVMELLRGEELGEVVARSGPLAPERVSEVFEELCHGVGAAHAAGIVHRDLKPENVFLAQSKRAGAAFTVKVLDFGIAKIVAEAKTSATATIGSPVWMAPEQTSRGEAITPATDVWALGLIAFYLLTGHVFWRAAGDPDASLTALLREIVLDPIPDVKVRATELGCLAALPPGFGAWFGRCVVRDARQRFQNAHEANQALRGALERPRQPSFAAPAPASFPFAATTPVAPIDFPAVRADIVPVHPAGSRRSWIPLAIGGAVAAGTLITVAVVLVSKAPSASQPAPHAASSKTEPALPRHLEAEAEANLQSILKGMQAAYERETMDTVLVAGESTHVTRKLCPSAKPVPTSLDSTYDKKYMAGPKEWSEDPGWLCLKFTMLEPQYFQYEVHTDQAKGTFRAFARRHMGDEVVEVSWGGEVRSGALVLEPKVEHHRHPFATWKPTPAPSEGSAPARK